MASITSDNSLDYEPCSSTMIEQPFKIFAITNDGNQCISSLEKLGFKFDYKYDKLAMYNYIAPGCISDRYEEILIKIEYKKLKHKKMALLNIKTSPNIRILNNNIFEFVLVLEKSKNPYFIQVSNVTDYDYEKKRSKRPNTFDIIKIKSPFINSKHKTNVIINNEKLSEVIFEPENQEENERKTIYEILKKIRKLLEPTENDLKNDFKKLARIVYSNNLRCRLKCLYLDNCLESCYPDYCENYLYNGSCSNKCYDYEWIRQNILHIKNRQYFEVYLTASELSRLTCAHNIIDCDEPYEQIPNKRKYMIYYDPDCRDPEYICLSKIADEIASKIENDLSCGRYNDISVNNGQKLIEKPRTRFYDCNLQPNTPCYNNFIGNNQNEMNLLPNQNSNACFYRQVKDTSGPFIPYQYDGYNQGNAVKGYCGQNIKNHSDQGMSTQNTRENINYLPFIQNFAKNILKVGLLVQQGCDQSYDIQNNLEERIINFLEMTKGIKDIDLLRYFLSAVCFCEIKFNYPEYEILKKTEFYPPKTAIDVKNGAKYSYQPNNVVAKILDQTGTSLEVIMQKYPALEPSISSYLQNIAQLCTDVDPGINSQPSDAIPKQRITSTCPFHTENVRLSAFEGRENLIPTKLTENIVLPQQYTTFVNNPQNVSQVPFYIKQQGSYPYQSYQQQPYNNMIGMQPGQKQNLQPSTMVGMQSGQMQYMQPSTMVGLQSGQMQNMQPSTMVGLQSGQMQNMQPRTVIGVQPGQMGYTQPSTVIGMQPGQVGNIQDGQSRSNIGVRPRFAQPITSMQPTTAGQDVGSNQQNSENITILPVVGEDQQEILPVDEDFEEDDESDISDESSSDDTATKRKITPKKKSKISSGAIVAIALTAVAVVIVVAGAVYYFLM